MLKVIPFAKRYLERRRNSNAIGSNPPDIIQSNQRENYDIENINDISYWKNRLEIARKNLGLTPGFTPNDLSYKNSTKDSIDLFKDTKFGLFFQNNWTTEEKLGEKKGKQKEDDWSSHDEGMDSIDEQPEKEKNKEERKMETKENRKMENKEIEKEENKEGEIDRDPNRVESNSWLFEESSKGLSKQGNGQS